MAVWRKVIVSGSQANLNTLQVDNLISGVVTGSSNGTLGIQAINGTGNIVATTGASGLSHSGSFSGSFTGIATGSFTGSFFGNGAGLTGIQATSLANSLNAGLGLSGSTFNGTAPATFSISGSAQLNSNFLTKWTGTGLGNALIYDDGTNLQITGSTITVNGPSSPTTFLVTGSVRSSGGFTGSLFGTSSWASQAQTASYVNNLNQNLSITGSLILSGSTGAELIVLGETQFTGSVSSLGGFTGSLFGTASYVTGSVFTSANPALSASYALTASYAANGGTLLNSLSPGLGLSGSAFNGSSAQSFFISGAAQLTTNTLPKWTGTGFNNTSIQDLGTSIEIGTVTNRVPLNVYGNLTVAGTASFTNTDSLFVADKFIALASGAASPSQAGIIAIGSAAMTGSAIFLDTVGPNGRWAVTASLHATASGATADEYVVTVKTGTFISAATPTYGGSTSGLGSMWVVGNLAGDIYIWG